MFATKLTIAGGIIKFFSPTSLLSLIAFCSLVISGCNKAKPTHSGAPGQKAESTNNVDEGYEAQKDGPACKEPPLNEVNLKYVLASASEKKVLSAKELKQEDTKKLFKNGKYLCGFAENKSPENLVELAIIIGSTKGLDAFASDYKMILEYWPVAAAGSHRIGCIYAATAETFNILSQKKKLRSIVILGHGVDGDLKSIEGTSSLAPEGLPKFVAEGLKSVHFFSCQAGKKEDSWKALFPKSPKVSFDISQEDIPVNEAHDKILAKKGLLEEFWQCRQ